MEETNSAGNDASAKDSSENNETNDNTTTNENNKANSDNVYGYLERNLFTSEIFKIELRNLPRHYGISELKKLLSNKLHLKVRKLKAIGRNSKWLYICLDSKEEQLKSVEVLNNYKWKGSILEAKLADPAPDPLVKRKLENQSNSSAKKPKIETLEQLEESLKNSVTPWWNVPYQDQLSNKIKHAKFFLQRLGYDFIKVNPKSSDYVNKQKDLYDGATCKISEMKSVEDFNFYRNKCEFTVGTHALTNKKTVGFRLGTYASGSVEVGSVEGLQHLSKPMFKAVSIFQEFISDSEIDCYSPETLSGQWCQYTVRVGTNTGQIMAIVGVSTINSTEELISKARKEVLEYFKTGKGTELKLESLYFQLVSRKQPGKDAIKPELLLGSDYIEEILCGYKFKISPQSFFQINTKCAELLIEGIKELGVLTKDVTLLDICCGTGTLGICLAKLCDQVLGVEKDQQAVEDAKENAALNKIENCEFISGSADAVLGSVVQRVKNNKVVAIVDPPRAGLHTRAIQLLRKTDKITQVIYLSCDCKLAYQNFLDLCKAESKTMIGLPFYLMSATPVDMFPHTDRYELILHFVRENLVSFD